MGRTGRRAENSAETKAQILEAARGVFATLGYDGTTMRRIAVDSGVDSTLISHYFGTKQELFVAVHELPINPSDPALLIDGPDDEVGERVALFAVTMLATDDSTAVSLMRSSVSSPSATTMLRQFIEKALIDPIAEPIGGSDARERVALTATQILDVLFAPTHRSCARTGCRDSRRSCRFDRSGAAALPDRTPALTVLSMRHRAWCDPSLSPWPARR